MEFRERHGVGVSHGTPVYEPLRLLLTVAQAAEYMQCSRRTVERLIARGDLTPVHVGSRRRLRVEELDRYLEREPAP